jgi:hypothetical protein
LPPGRASGIQASSSQAMHTISHQIWFWANPAGQVAQPGVLRSGCGPRIWPGGGDVVPGQRAGRPCVGGKAGEPVAADVGEPCWLRGVLRTMTRMPRARLIGPACR